MASKRSLNCIGILPLTLSISLFYLQVFVNFPGVEKHSVRAETVQCSRLSTIVPVDEHYIGPKKQLSGTSDR